MKITRHNHHIITSPHHLIILFCFLLSAFSLNAQQTPIPNGSFEDNEKGWRYDYSNYFGYYWEFETDLFYTLNSLRQLKNDQGAPDLTAFKEGNAQHGANCIKLVSGRVAAGTSYVFLPGMVGTITQDFVDEFLNYQGKVTKTKIWEYDTPHALEGYFKYKPVENDSALIDIAFYNNDKPVFIVQKIIKETITNKWEKFSIDIPSQYWNKVYDEIRIIFAASAGVNWERLDECKGRLGSTLWIDNVSLNYTKDPNGIKQNLFSTLKANAFPNPATEVINIELNENFTGTVSVYNITGSKVMEENMNGTQIQLNTSTLAAGNYIYKLMNENTIFAQGKFVISK